MAQICRICGNVLAEGMMFCPKCGGSVNGNGMGDMVGRAYYAEPEKKSSTGAIVAFIFGILSLVFFWFPVLGFIFELVAIVLGKLNNKECFSNAKQAKAGFIMGIIALILGIILLIGVSAFNSGYGSGYDFGYGSGFDSGFDSGYEVPWYKKIF